MSTHTVLLVLVVATGLVFDLMNGFHDGCNAVSTVIYTGALKPRTAAVPTVLAYTRPMEFAGPDKILSGSKAHPLARATSSPLSMGPFARIRPIATFSVGSRVARCRVWRLDSGRP